MENMDLALSDWKEAVVLSVREKKYDNESWGHLINDIINSGKDINVTTGIRSYCTL
jgi:hypothetical protein